jgi:hypothetical protein
LGDTSADCAPYEASRAIKKIEASAWLVRGELDRRGYSEFSPRNVVFDIRRQSLGELLLELAICRRGRRIPPTHIFD